MEKQMNAVIKTQYKKMKIAVENEVNVMESSRYLDKKKLDAMKNPSQKINLGHVHKVILGMRKGFKKFIKKEKLFRFDDNKLYKKYSYTDIIYEFNKRY